MHLIGVLLAAGRSGRMGRLKQLLPWPPETGAQTVVSAAYDAVATNCCAMVVVLGHEAEKVRAALGDRNYVAVHVDSKAEMIRSVKAGLQAAQALHATADVLLHPADHPEVASDTLRLLIEAGAAHVARAVMPTFGDRGGHPVLIPAGLVAAILAYRGPGGLRQFWREHEDQCVRLPVEDLGATLDVDTPADYEARKS